MGTSLRDEIAYELFLNFSLNKKDDTTTKDEWQENYQQSAKHYLEVADKILMILERHDNNKCRI